MSSEAEAPHSTPPAPRLRSSALAHALSAARANLRPGLALQAVALTVVVGYYRSDVVRDALDALGALKTEYGYGFSAVSTIVSGGIIPYLFLALSGKIGRGRHGTEIAFLLGFWLWRGLEVDLLYRMQAVWFGAEPTVTSVLSKMAVDQFIYNPLWIAPMQTLLMALKEEQFSIDGVRRRFARVPFGERMMLMLVSNWVVWIPAVTIVYCLPAPLQLPLSNVVICFWAFMLTSVSRDEA